MPVCNVLRLAGAAVACAILATGCGSASSPPAAAGAAGPVSGQPSAPTASSAGANDAAAGPQRRVDPQVLSDVIDGVFPVPGPSQLRTIRIMLASIGVPNVACGGKNFPDPNGTDSRFDQSHYADLDLIAEKGLVEPVQDKPRLADEKCLRTKTPSYDAWYALVEPWSEATRNAESSPAVRATHQATASCLTSRTGLAVDVDAPTGSYLNKVDYAMSGMTSAAEETAGMKKFSVAYADCARAYFDAMKAELLRQRTPLVERNRELLERYASELVAAGYVP